ncbi:putative membrane protein [Pseudomonas cerasi]|uniref:Putative membrane protein n=1 Tax=Pseudomonas cerasi TaxID=1583341 RepID=A0A2K4VB97_9PSED|nr:putative membrane protein [Pseudomonas cerasi]
MSLPMFVMAVLSSPVILAKVVVRIFRLFLLQ